MTKKFFIFSIIILVGFIIGSEIRAGAGDNVYGWAWAENIGWVSFNNITGGGGIDYGVNIDSGTGLFFGYAWSEHIGWISFEPGDVNISDCPDYPASCQAVLDFDTLEVFGWARALANGDGWDGWIKLRGTWTNGVSLNSAPTPSEFEGWAWGSDVVGWISFNRSDTGAGVDYKVMADLVINNPPTAAISCNPASCEVYETEVLILQNDSTDPDGEGDIIQSIWYVDGNEKTSCAGKCNFTPQNWVGVGSYLAELYIEDSVGQSDADTENFRIKRDISAGFMCSLDNSNWEDCGSIEPRSGDTVYFKDDPSLTEYSWPSEDATIISRVWEKDGVVFDSGNNNNPSIEAETPSMDIKLTVQDTAGRQDFVIHIIGVRMRLPKWKEVVPTF